MSILILNTGNIRPMVLRNLRPKCLKTIYFYFYLLFHLFKKNVHRKIGPEISRQIGRESSSSAGSPPEYPEQLRLPQAVWQGCCVNHSLVHICQNLKQTEH